MSHESITIGRVEVVPLCDGWAPLPLADECPGREVDWAIERSHFPWAFPPGDPSSWAWHVHAFLLRTPAGNVLVDAGIGHLGRPPYEVTGRLPEELEAAGAPAESIGHVVHSHLHFDHAGGAVRPDGTPSFPNAVHHVHPSDWTFFAEDPEGFGARKNLERLERDGRLDLTPEDGEITRGVRVIHSPGHTPGHRCVMLEDGGGRLLLAGDLLHVPIQVAHPGWLSSHDEEPDLGARRRTEVLGHAQREGWDVAVSHFGRPFGRVGERGWQA